MRLGRVLSVLVTIVLVAGACGTGDTSPDVAGSDAVSTSRSPGSNDDVVEETTIDNEPAAGQSGSPTEPQPSTTSEVSTPPTTPPTPSTTGTTTPKSTPPASGTPAGSARPTYPGGGIDNGLQPFIDMAIADLAERLGITASEIQVAAAVLVTWSDASLGCPQPGMEYAQVLQDGSVIELNAADRYYRYHSGGSRSPFLCDQPLPNPPIPVGGSDV